MPPVPPSLRGGPKPWSSPPAAAGVQVLLQHGGPLLQEAHLKHRQASQRSGVEAGVARLVQGSGQRGVGEGSGDQGSGKITRRAGMRRRPAEKKTKNKQKKTTTHVYLRSVFGRSDKINPVYIYAAFRGWQNNDGPRKAAYCSGTSAPEPRGTFLRAGGDLRKVLTFHLARAEAKAL